jgi:protein-disulfide isomerase
MAVRVLTPLLCFAFIALGCGTEELQASATSNVAAPGAAAPAEPSADGSAAAATIAGETISIAELDAWIRDDLFEQAWDSESELFELRSESLERMTTERILEKAAAARNMNTNDYVLAEVDAQGEISDEEIAAFYDERKDQLNQTIEELTPNIRKYLRMQRGAEYVEQLHADAGYTLLLEQPQIEMAADGPSRGPDDAAVTIIEFSDFQCPYCSRALPAINEILEHYPNDVRIVYRHLPLDRIHARARPAAAASLCADEQGEFWAYHDQLFANAKALSEEDLKRYAEAVELDVAAFDLCVAEGRFEAKVQEDFEAAMSAGISSTPAFLVNGIFVGGAKPFAHFEKIIDAELAKRNAGGDAS